MTELTLPDHIAERIDSLYERLDLMYNKVAAAIDFGCSDCPDNCCDSFFQHHTYVEWAYLWRGLRNLDEETREKVQQWAVEYIEQCKKAMAEGDRPQVMCPLNDEGLCILYSHRLLVCRTHGVPARLRRPDGKLFAFPGCFRCQEQVEEREASGLKTPSVDRTALLTELAGLEDELLGYRRQMFPKVRMTIAEMIVAGPPPIPQHLQE